MTYISCSSDGYGDRDDIALAKDRDQEQIRKNKSDEWHTDIPSSEYASSAEEGTPITEIVRRMTLKNRRRALLWKSSVFWDVETLYDACLEISLEAITPEGEDLPVAADIEWFEPSVHECGWQIEICI